MLPAIAFAAAVTFAPACRPVAGEWILARDLAAVNPVFATLDGSKQISAAPMPGATRIFRVEELARLVRMNQLPDEGPLNEVCFVWPMAPPNAAALAAAMARTLACDPSAIEVIEANRYPVPEGRLEFPRDRLAELPGPGNVLVWKGAVQYGDHRTMPVWAKVRISVPSVRVRTRVSLAPGQPIQASDLELSEDMKAPFGGDWARTIEEVAGRAPRARMEAGAPIRLSALVIAPEIAAGEIVQVRARRGHLEVRMEARADMSGRTGDVIPLTNLSSGAKLRARVEGKGRLTVLVR